MSRARLDLLVSADNVARMLPPLLPLMEPDAERWEELVGLLGRTAATQGDKKRGDTLCCSLPRVPPLADARGVFGYTAGPGATEVIPGVFAEGLQPVAAAYAFVGSRDEHIRLYRNGTTPTGKLRLWFETGFSYNLEDHLRKITEVLAAAIKMNGGEPFDVDVVEEHGGIISCSVADTLSWALGERIGMKSWQNIWTYWGLERPVNGEVLRRALIDWALPRVRA